MGAASTSKDNGIFVTSPGQNDICQLVWTRYSTLLLQLWNHVFWSIFQSECSCHWDKVSYIYLITWSGQNETSHWNCQTGQSDIWYPVQTYWNFNSITLSERSTCDYVWSWMITIISLDDLLLSSIWIRLTLSLHPWKRHQMSLWWCHLCKSIWTMSILYSFQKASFLSFRLDWVISIIFLEKVNLVILSGWDKFYDFFWIEWILSFPPEWSPLLTP